jgi:hypothetical protein
MVARQVISACLDKGGLLALDFLRQFDIAGGRVVIELPQEIEGEEPTLI